MLPLAEQNGISIEKRIEVGLPPIEADREELIRLQPDFRYSGGMPLVST